MDLQQYSGYRPRSMRTHKASSDSSRGSKRSRLSKARGDRALYTSSKGWKHNPVRYAELCAISDKLNGVRRVSSDQNGQM